LERKKRYPLREAEALKLLANNGCLYCRKPNAGHTKDNCPEKIEKYSKKPENPNKYNDASSQSAHQNQ
jgi:UDP-N-acetylglucosamine:LPS N-acetylglucosamine transferase